MSLSISHRMVKFPCGQNLSRNEGERKGLGQ